MGLEPNSSPQNRLVKWELPKSYKDYLRHISSRRGTSTGVVVGPIILGVRHTLIKKQKQLYLDSGTYGWLSMGPRHRAIGWHFTKRKWWCGGPHDVAWWWRWSCSTCSGMNGGWRKKHWDMTHSGGLSRAEATAASTSSSSNSCDVNQGTELLQWCDFGVIGGKVLGVTGPKGLEERSELPNWSSRTNNVFPLFCFRLFCLQFWFE